MKLLKRIDTPINEIRLGMGESLEDMSAVWLERELKAAGHKTAKVEKRVKFAVPPGSIHKGS